jgi:hypothetical protein
MSKLGCVCGHIIRDQADNLPYKGTLIPDQNFNVYYDEILETVGAFVKAVRNDTDKEWITQHFGTEYAALTLDDTSIISDLLAKFFVDFSLTIFQCENCGRIHIEGENHFFHSFAPDDTESRDVLEGKPKP